MLALLGMAAGCVTQPAPEPPPPPLPAIPPPHVMVVLGEKDPTGQAGALCESIAVPLLQAHRVPIVDPATQQASQEHMRRLLLQHGDEQGALLAGQPSGADVVISGQVEARHVADQIAGSNLKSYLGTVTLRAIGTEDAQVLATAADTATAIALDEASGSAKALRLALGRALDSMIPSLLHAWEALPETVRLARRGATPETQDAAAEDPPPPLPGHQPPVAAIWQLSAQTGVSSNWMPVLTETLFACAQRSQWFRLVTRDDMAKLLSEHKLQLSELCDSSARAAEFGRILNAQKMIIGTASRLGATFQVVIKLVDVETGEVEKVGQASGGGNLDVLLRLVRLAVADLLRTGAPAGDAAEPEQT